MYVYYYYYPFGPIHTCEGPGFISTLDYVAIPVEMIPKVSSSRVLQEHCLNTSDHMALSIVLRVEGVKIAQVQNDSQGRVRWDKMTKADVKRKYESPLQTKFSNILSRLQRTVGSAELIDSTFKEITKDIHETSDRLPRSKFKKHLKPFWNAEMDILKANKISAYRVWVDAGRPRDITDQRYINYKDSKKRFMKRLTALSKEYESTEILSAVRMAEIDKNCFW